MTIVTTYSKKKLYEYVLSLSLSKHRIVLASTFHRKEALDGFYSSIFKLPAPLLLHFGAIVK